MALPIGTYGCIAPQSRLAVRHGLDVGAGVVDSDYRGDIKVLLFNHGQEMVNIEKSDCIAQLIPEKYDNRPLKEVNQMDHTEREAKGFGSTDLFEMEPDLVEIYTIDLMPTATEEQLKQLVPSEYHDYLDIFDPEGLLRQLPPL